MSLFPGWHDFWTGAGAITGWEIGGWTVCKIKSWRLKREFAAMKERMDMLLDPEQTPIPEPGSHRVEEES